ncbi:hypothetical protein EMIHUDRAFT_459473, partial [Emiliania huxleyi CCMP1516]|uniref:Uncharacterized protein n=2 Tax=Emiliania huxleyi TaxID=2903 RepID=A0A0D3IRT9_EMIH1
MPCRSFAHSPPLPLARPQAKNALANLLAAQPEAGIAKKKDVVAFERLLTEVAKRAAEADQAQTLLSDKVFDNLFTYLSDNVTLWAPSESAKALDPDDGLLYSTLDVLLSASDSLPVPLAEACVEHLHSLARTSHAAPDRHVGARCSHLTPPPSTQVDIVMSTDLHPEAQELSADLINHAMREQTKACKAKFHADAGEDSSCAALLQGAEGVLMRAASLGLQLRLVDLLVSLGKRARDVIGGLFGSQFALGHGPEFVQTAFRCLSAFNAAHSTAVTPVTARISSAFGCRIKGASGGASCEVFFGNRGAIEVLAQEGGPLFEAQQAQHGPPLKFRLSGVAFDQPGTLTLNVDMAKVRDLFDDRAANGTLRLVLSGADAERLRSRVLPVLPAKLLTETAGGEPKAKPRQSLPSRAKKD